MTKDLDIEVDDFAIVTTEDVGVAIPGDQLLSFKPTGRLIQPYAIAEEFELMRQACRKELTLEILVRICEKSGTHLVKLVTPRADGNQAILRFESLDHEAQSPFLPSVNAPDIPFAKIIFRPLEITGFPSRSLVEHVRAPDALSDRVISAFGDVFGLEHMQLIGAILLEPAPVIHGLPVGEFPIIFIPSPKGGDLQITPVSPASSFMEMKAVMSPYFQKQIYGGPRVPRGRWHKQAISSKPQNISGAIGGPRVRFLAEMPAGMQQYDAEIYRFVHGGGFPRWREKDVDVWILRYADLLARDKEFNNQDTRAGLDRLADRLIRDAEEFSAITMEDAKRIADASDIAHEKLKAAPDASLILLRRSWSDDGFNRARMALNSSHFDHRKMKIQAWKEDKS